MKILTKNSDYAIRALIEIALNQKELLSAREIAKKQKIPYQYLRRILQELIKHDFIAAKEGKGGGFKLKKNPKHIQVSEILKIYQGPIQISECLFRKKMCHNANSCPLRHEILAIESKVVKEFKGITIAKLIGKL